jgi:hypothetical protein
MTYEVICPDCNLVIAWTDNDQDDQIMYWLALANLRCPTCFENHINKLRGKRKHFGNIPRYRS